MRLRLEDATVELRRLEADARGHAADKRHHERTIQGLEAQSADLSRQVQLLLHEVTELKGGATMTKPPPPGAAAAANGVGGMNAAAVITSRLVDFRDIAELQEQNRSQLEVIRKLSADQEDMGSRLKSEYQAQVEKIQSEAQTALDELESRKEKTQTMVEAIVRQRDMYKALYASSAPGVNGGAADADAAALSLAAAASASLAKSGGGASRRRRGRRRRRCNASCRSWRRRWRRRRRGDGGHTLSSRRSTRNCRLSSPNTRKRAPPMRISYANRPTNIATSPPPPRLRLPRPMRRRNLSALDTTAWRSLRRLRDATLNNLWRKTLRLCDRWRHTRRRCATSGAIGRRRGSRRRGRIGGEASGERTSAFGAG